MLALKNSKERHFCAKLCMHNFIQEMTSVWVEVIIYLGGLLLAVFCNVWVVRKAKQPHTERGDRQTQ